MKTSSDTIGDRTRNLPACSAVPQRNALPGVPVSVPIRVINCYIFVFHDLLTLPLISVTVSSVESYSNCGIHTPLRGEFRTLYCEMSYVKMSVFAL
jgi:hypothetical protein